MAVLLMMVILLVGILFVSVVSYNQGQSSRHTDTMDAKSLSDTGIKMADAMLQQSPLGADWRPPFQAATGAEDPADASTWPTPPAEYVDGAGNVVDYDLGFWGPDAVQGTEDDYYTDDEIAHGYPAQRLGTHTTPGDFVRYGFSRYPDRSRSSNAAGTMTVANVPIDNDVLGRGHFLLRVSYSPIPVNATSGTTLDPNAKYIKIESVGHVDEGPTVWRKQTAYKPIGVGEYVVFVTDKSSTGRPASLGIAPWVDMSNSGFVSVDTTSDPAVVPISRRGDFLVTELDGPIKSNAPLRFEGDHLTLTGGGSPTPQDGSSVQVTMYDNAGPDGYLRHDTIEASGGISESNPNTVAAVVNGAAPARVTPTSLGTGFDTLGGLVVDGTSNLDANGFSRFSRRVSAPELFPGASTAGSDRYQALTRDSGTAVRNPATSTYENSGRYGLGEGIYVDNTADVQFAAYDPNTGLATHDLTALSDDWLRALSPRDPRAGDSGWNATQTTYIPKAVEIEFYPSEAAALGYGTYSIAPNSDTQPPSNAFPGAGSQVWWPNHQAGMPGIKITRHDKRWQVGLPTPAPPFDFGSDSGQNVIFLDYPKNGVILTEGNVRVKGELPSRRDTASPFAMRRPEGFGVTVVSGATIYIDGELLSPQDRYGRKAQDNNSYDPANGVTDEDTPKVALLARDCVCLNPTQIVPQLTAGMASAAADDMANPSPTKQHWVLGPGAAGQIYTRFQFGEPPAGTKRVELVARHMSADPGPAAISMTVSHSDDVAGAYTPLTPFDFSGTGDYSYIFAPPGTLLQGGGVVPNNPGLADICAPWLSPVWPSAASYVPTLISPTMTPTTPAWNVGGLLSGTPGDQNVISLTYSDPRLQAGSSDYWLKSFKVQEFDNLGGGGGPTWVPTGSIHARIHAIVYAETGCWFVIPGAYFDATTVSVDANGDGAINGSEAFNAAVTRRYNYDIQFIGSITENYTASPDAVRDWTDKWAYPDYRSATAYGWGTIRYTFDESLRAARDQAATTLAGGIRTSATTRPTNWANLPKAPCLPVSPDLIYYGE